jgi:Ca2+-binding RTX toxin-like protein
MATFQGTDLGDVLQIGAFPFPSITKDGQVLNPLILIQPSDLAGNDNILLLGGPDAADGGAGDDTIDSGAGDDNPINGGDGNDSIILGEGNDTGFGSEGNDTLFGGLGINNVDGGNGNDYLSYLNVTPSSPSGASQVVVDLSTKGEVYNNAFVSIATDNITSIENVIGAPGLFNSLTGTTGDNIIIGGAASDFISSAGGKDSLKGGLGDDFYTVVTTSNGTQIEDAGGTTDNLNIPAVTLLLSGPTTTGYGLERQGKNLAIDLDLDGKIDSTKDLLIVDFYADTTAKTAGTGFIENVVNLKGEDILTSNIPNTAPPPTSNVIWTTPTASPSNPGPDVPAPEGGNTTFVDQGITSYVFTNAADNTFVPATAANLYTQALNGNDFVIGTASADNINGNLGDDVILAGAGNDGDRTINIPANTIRTAVRGGKGSDNLDGQEGDDLLNGNLENDTVFGGAGNDIVRGGKGADVLDGGLGADYLIGDADQDKLTGGADADIFVLPGVSIAATSSNQADLITDFVVGTDKIMLPTGTTFAQLTLTAVTVQLDGGTSVPSTAIQSGTSYYGLVQGITPVQLTDTNFIADDPNITVLG